jgi:hypothetical protein
MSQRTRVNLPSPLGAAAAKGLYPRVMPPQGRECLLARVEAHARLRERGLTTKLPFGSGPFGFLEVGTHLGY